MVLSEFLTAELELSLPKKLPSFKVSHCSQAINPLNLGGLLKAALLAATSAVLVPQTPRPRGSASAERGWVMLTAKLKTTVCRDFVMIRDTEEMAKTRINSM